MARRRETAETREQKLLGKIIHVEPVTDGITKGKLKLTFADGSCAIFKPASGEGGEVRSKKKEDLGHAWITLSPIQRHPSTMESSRGQRSLTESPFGPYVRKI